MLERRRHRSVRPAEAINFYLEAARERLGIRALTLGTPEGWLIAGAGREVDRVAELGARGELDALVDGDVATWRTRLGETEVVLTSWGRAMDAELADDVRRILG